MAIVEGLIMRIILALTIIAAISACGKNEPSVAPARSDDIQADLRKKLVNPETAKFGEVIESADGRTACLMFDSKGTTGQYMGWGSALLHKQNGKWVITALNGNPAECRLKK